MGYERSHIFPRLIGQPSSLQFLTHSSTRLVSLRFLRPVVSANFSRSIQLRELQVLQIFRCFDTSSKSIRLQSQLADRPLAPSAPSPLFASCSCVSYPSNLLPSYTWLQGPSWYSGSMFARTPYLAISTYLSNNSSTVSIPLASKFSEFYTSPPISSLAGFPKIPAFNVRSQNGLTTYTASISRYSYPGYVDNFVTIRMSPVEKVPDFTVFNLRLLGFNREKILLWRV
ncbi:uncharacterized protein BDR25DRAFT_352840 [Lindgomyces ingoldianus]|uniref:Uncharacterized protein n=1 Tax=Lindgomyces ingoldianus TaxID=673940 RepID=A0ACB6R3S4_9PLEO|nr:uncharacterized protein BDR25DRAFT_352840 [Lindgomyces ingoldianus]KAF2473425.1 hypothetical protein BDR25DRAFT_352840 [Lindgomyces ingoldianus]